jgi:hypothetical protein
MAGRSGTLRLRVRISLLLETNRAEEGQGTDLAPRAGLEPATFRLTAEVVEILNALSCVAYRETRPIFSPSVGLLGLPVLRQSFVRMKNRAIHRREPQNT